MKEEQSKLARSRLGSMFMKTNNSEGKGLDLVTPIVEIVQEVATLLIKFLIVMAKLLFNRITKKVELKTIDRKVLSNKKTSNKVADLGHSASQGSSLKLSDIDFGKHSFIVGAAGFGKTNLISILQENSLAQNKPVIFFDPKGDREALETFKALCKAKDKKCYIFSEHYPESISLNPLKEGTINQITDRIMGAFDWSEQFYKDMAEQALRKVIKLLVASKKEVTLKGIYDLLVLKFEAKETVGLIVKLESLIQSDFGKLLEGGEKSKTFSQIRDEKACLYLGLSTQGYGETAMALGKIFLGELLYHSYFTLKTNANSHDSMANAISVYFDEFGSLVTPRFIELQNKCRGAGIELTMAVQSASDIDRLDENLTKQILENSANLFILKQRLDEGASLFSKSIGTISAIKKTYVTEDGDQQSKGSMREVNELIVHPDIIKNLKVGQCILLRHNPTRVDLVNIRNRRLDVVKGVQNGASTKSTSVTISKVEDTGSGGITTGANLPNSFNDAL